jgi:hypothetical protein
VYIDNGMLPGALGIIEENIRIGASNRYLALRDGKDLTARLALKNGQRVFLVLRELDLFHDPLRHRCRVVTDVIFIGTQLAHSGGRVLCRIIVLENRGIGDGRRGGCIERDLDHLAALFAPRLTAGLPLEQALVETILGLAVGADNPNHEKSPIFEMSHFLSNTS